MLQKVVGDVNEEAARIISFAANTKKTVRRLQTRAQLTTRIELLGGYWIAYMAMDRMLADALRKTPHEKLHHTHIHIQRHTI